jgi:hypothetical protein
MREIEHNTFKSHIPLSEIKTFIMSDTLENPSSDKKTHNKSCNLLRHLLSPKKSKTKPQATSPPQSTDDQHHSTKTRPSGHKDRNQHSEQRLSGSERPNIRDLLPPSPTPGEFERQRQLEEGQQQGKAKWDPQRHSERAEEDARQHTEQGEGD